MTLRTTRRTILVGGGSVLLGWMGASCAGDDGLGGTGGGESSTGGPNTSGGPTSQSTTAGTDGSATMTTAPPTGDATTAGDEESGLDESSTGEPSECDMDGYLAGGTAAMAGDYPSPFDGEPENCELFSAQTCGPCYAAGPDRKDITSGLLGLPMRMNLRIVYEGTCEGVADASVDVWFANREGEYSGDTPSAICNNGNPDVIAQDFMRGQQSTDDSGLVEFDAVFPGWYPGRTTHIHVLVIVGGTFHYVTQLYFGNALAEGIYMAHEDYSHRPERNVNNEGDGPFDEASPNLMSTRKTYDCALQAWATIAIPETPDGVSC